MGIQSQRIGSILLVSCALSARAAWGIGTLDQAFEPLFTVGYVLGGIHNCAHTEQRAAQTFTVGMDGELACAAIYVSNYYPAFPAGPLVVEIRSTTAGVPDDTVLTSATRPASSIPNFYSFQTFNFPDIPVAAGDVLAIVVRGDYADLPAFPWYYWKGVQNPQGVYAGGEYFYSGNGTPWTRAAIYDFPFRTYMSSPLTVTTASWGAVKALYR